MTPKERYLNNPHIKLDAKQRKQLGIDTQDVPASGPAISLPDPTPAANQEVVVRRQRDNHGIS